MGTVARLLDEHVSFRCTSVDRIGIRGYVPGLQYEGGVVKFLVNRGNTIPSPAALNRNHERLVAELDALVAASGVPVVRFKRGESKEDIARPYQDAGAGHRADRAGAGRQGPGADLVVAGLRRRQPSPRTAPAIRTSPGGASRRCPITGTSTSPTASGVRRSSSCARTRRIRCGAAPTATSGPNAS